MSSGKNSEAPKPRRTNLGHGNVHEFCETGVVVMAVPSEYDCDRVG